jgi:hypothetical protein
MESNLVGECCVFSGYDCSIGVEQIVHISDSQCVSAVLLSARGVQRVATTSIGDCHAACLRCSYDEDRWRFAPQFYLQGVHSFNFGGQWIEPQCRLETRWELGNAVLTLG